MRPHRRRNLVAPARRSKGTARLARSSPSENQLIDILTLSRSESRRKFMCGIAGIIGAEPTNTVGAAEIHQMCQTIIHRGPDDEGIYVHGHVGLGMRRLSIIDLSTGHQPIHNEDRTVWLVFNGEIYNFLDLPSQLEGRGHCFHPNTDTEVIVHLYEEYGPDCVQQLRGMFALALWDRSQQYLLLARDRFGKK